MSALSEWVHLDVTAILRETEKALQLRLGDRRELWVPKSQIADVDDYQVGAYTCTVSVKRWWAEKEELI